MSLTLTAELEKKTQAFEMKYYLRLLNISYNDHATNEDVRRKTQADTGKYDEPLTLVKKRNLRWFGHISREEKAGRRRGGKTILRSRQGLAQLWAGKCLQKSFGQKLSFYIFRSGAGIDRDGLC